MEGGKPVPVSPTTSHVLGVRAFLSFLKLGSQCCFWPVCSRSPCDFKCCVWPQHFSFLTQGPWICKGSLPQRNSRGTLAVEALTRHRHQGCSVWSSEAPLVTGPPFPVSTPSPLLLLLFFFLFTCKGLIHLEFIFKHNVR